jgi:hypothetical protein
LQWLSASGAVSYDIMAASDINFTNIIANQSSLSTTNFSLSGLSYYSDYYWKVRGVHPSNPGPWSDVWTFRTTSAPFVLNLSNKVTCKNAPVELGTLDAGQNIITATGGSGSFDYTWYPSYGLINSTTGNPTFANPQLSTTFTLTVKDRVYNTIQTGTVYVEVTNTIYVNMPVYKVIRRGSSVNLDAQIVSISGGTPPYTKVWKDNSGNILNNTTVTPTLGSHNYFLTVVDTKGCVLTKKLMVIVSSYRENIDEDNIVTNESGSMMIIAYPNPTIDNLYYSIIANDETNVAIELFDINGKVMLRNNVQANSQEQMLNISNLPAGTYFIKAVNDGESLIYKFIKK